MAEGRRAELIGDPFCGIDIVREDRFHEVRVCAEYYRGGRAGTNARDQIFAGGGPIIAKCLVVLRLGCRRGRNARALQPSKPSQRQAEKRRELHPGRTRPFPCAPCPLLLACSTRVTRWLCRSSTCG